MIELILVYCLIDQPDRCVEKREPLSGDVGPVACTINAQQYAQDYVEAHPNYRLAGFRCEVDKPDERPT